MSKAPAFQFYAQDFLTGCTYLTNDEIGMYIKMLCKQWTDGNIPKKRLGFLLGLEWVSLSEELKGKFIDFGEYVINERLEKEREKKQNFREKQSENGKKGGRPRKINEVESLESIENTSETEFKKPNKPKPLKKLNPNDNQKKPLEDRSKKIEEEIEIEKKGKVGFENLLISESFIPIWNDWIDYRKAKKKKPYAAIKYEQIALDSFIKISNNNPEIAKEILQQTISKNWEGLFELKNNNQNGSSKSNTAESKQPVAGRQSAETIAKNLQGW